ncbi:helix-turn-helix domain-containing protein, partial [Mycobacterium tuberculosis]
MLAHGQLLARIKEWIVRNLDDPALDAAVIARHFGLSRSGLYRLFAVEGESPGAWLTARRLDEAHLILSDGSRRDGTITTVCYRLGF